MKKFFSLLTSYLKAAGCFGRALVQPTERFIALSENGHGILDGWRGTPEDQILQLFDRRVSDRNALPTFALYGLQGPHRQQLLLGPQGRSSIGLGPQCGITLTPARERAPQEIHVFSGKYPRFESKDSFKVNGQEAQSSDLYDYDELEMSGNRFLYLDLRMEEAHV